MDSATICQHPRISARRRSKRIALTVPVEISGKDAEQCSFTLTTTASNLNRNGAMLQLNRDLVADSVLVIQNARRARASARVVARLRRLSTRCPESPVSGVGLPARTPPSASAPRAARVVSARRGPVRPRHLFDVTGVRRLELTLELPPCVVVRGEPIGKRPYPAEVVPQARLIPKLAGA